MTMKKRFLFILSFFLGATSVLAQGGPPPPGGGDVDDVIVPIDDHIWILIVLAVAFALYLLKSQRFQVKA